MPTESKYYSVLKAILVTFTNDEGNEQSFYQLTNKKNKPVLFLGEQTEMSHNVYGLKMKGSEPEVSLYISEEQFNKMKGKDYHAVITIDNGIPQITEVHEKKSNIPSELLNHTSFFNSLPA